MRRLRLLTLIALAGCAARTTTWVPAEGADPAKEEAIKRDFLRGLSRAKEEGTSPEPAIEEYRRGLQEQGGSYREE
jgi:hypothetical protein